MLPQRKCTVWFGWMNEKKRRFVDDEIVVTLIYDFEVKHQGSVTVSVAHRQLASRRLALP